MIFFLKVKKKINVNYAKLQTINFYLGKRDLGKSKNWHLNKSTTLFR